ncbi:hypothetical protein RB653_008211 [Dictyostelium firmibasis]|uniref:Alpha/beta hydrolase fold-3 domain-containing protein n=1 Tax=Dictyostelium firmibasis TaxID=79012 RepID=A0AAN7YP52_9MYCE
MDPESYGLDKTAVDICNSLMPILDIEPKLIREGFKSLYETQKKHISKTEQYQLTKENGDRLMDVHFFYPKGYENNSSDHKYPVIFYIHGGGFMVDGIKKLPREISDRTNSVLIYPDYGLIPEEKYPLGINQCHQLFVDIMNGNFNPFNDLNIDSISIIGESSGGNYALALPLKLVLSKSPLLMKISKVLVYYPITDSNFESPSYNRFAEKFYLTKEGMKWCWNHYTNNDSERDEITCCPLKATIDQLKDFPETMVMTAETDVLSSEGEEFGLKLSKANVKVSVIRILKTIHGFVSLDQTNDGIACRVGMDVSMNFLNNISNDSVINENNNKNLLKLI